MLADRVRMCSYKGRKILIDRTTPATVINQPYSTEGNGGRKLVRLIDGTLVCVVRDIVNTSYILYKSTNNGETWGLLRSQKLPTSVEDVSIVAIGNNIGAIYNISNKQVGFAMVNMNNVITNGINLDTQQVELGKCSIEINSEGTELHACWSSKNATYPNSFNIRYCKGAVNGDGSVTWGSVEQLTSFNILSSNNISPAIVIVNNKPIITFIRNSLTGSEVICIFSLNPTRTKTIYLSNNSYPQSNPSDGVSKDGVIHVAWVGTTVDTNGYAQIFYSSSIDGGTSWASPRQVSSGNSNKSSPTICGNAKGELFITFDTGIPSIGIQTRKRYPEGQWIAVGINYANSINPSSLLDNELDFELPLIIFSDSNSVKFAGKWNE